MAKGGNGHHSVATPQASDNGKGKAHTSDADKKPGKAAKPKAASPQGTTANRADAGKKPGMAAKPQAASPQGTTAKNVVKLTREAPRTEKPQSATHEPPAGATPSTKAVPGSPPSTGLAEARISSDTVEEAGVETRGVLDTIRVKVNASLEGLRATAGAMWSAVTSWFGD
jgi:hypothetical protein